MTVREPLNRVEESIAAFIRTYTIEHGYPPGVREIGRAQGMRSTSTVHARLESMARKGWLRREPRVSRGLTLIP